MPTVQAVVDGYLEHLREQMLSDAHTTTVRQRLSFFLREQEGKLVNADRLIGFVSPADVAAHLRRFEEKRDAAEGYMAGLVSTHKAFWRWAYQKGYTRQDLGEKLRGRSYRPQIRRPAPEADIAAVAAALPRYAARGGFVKLRDALLVSMSLDSGARRRALRNLRKDALEEALRAPAQTPAGPLFTALSFSKGKTAKIRFSQVTADLARRLLEQLPGECRHVFVSSRTWKQLHQDSLSDSFRRLCAFAGVPTFQSHAVRKRNTTDVARMAGLEAARKYAGHSDAKVTREHYVDAFSDDVEEAAATIAARHQSNNELDEMARLFGLDR